MNTKRCAYCHKLQRAEAPICSRCGRAFVQKKPGSFIDDVTHPSLPHASPHRAGHYTGLHPEDQPYQSSKMAAQRRPPSLEVEPWQYLHQEPEHIVLPGTSNAPARLDKTVEEETLPAQRVSFKLPPAAYLHKPAPEPKKTW